MPTWITSMRNHMHPSVAVASLLACAAICCLAQPPQSTAAPAQTTPQAQPLFRAGDEVLVQAPSVADLKNQAFVIQPDGNINVPYIGWVSAAGITAEQLQDQLRRRLENALHQSEIALTVARRNGTEAQSEKGAVSIQPATRPAAGKRAAPDKELTAAVTNYILGPEDQIIIRALNVPDISEKPTRVGLNGDISVLMVGRIHVAGMTLEQLEAELTRRLKVYYEDPEVTVQITEFRSEPVSVVGRVTSPGVHQLQGNANLLEILTKAGGLQPDAAPELRITRRLEWGRVPLPGATDDPTGQFSIAEVDIRSLTEGNSPDLNIQVRPHDVISIPKANIVYIIGDVAHAGPLMLSKGQSISMLQALSESGGILKTAAPGRAKILRPIMGGPKRAEVSVDIDKILHGKGNDIPLLAGDILFIPGSKSKEAMSKAISTAIQAGTVMGTAIAVR